MKKQEVIKILAVCKEAGISFAENSNKNVLVELWDRSFKNNTYEEVSQALFDLIQTKKGLFLNGLIGEIKSQLVANQYRFDDFTTVWEQIRKAAHKTHPDIPAETEKAFNSLSPILRHLVGSSRHLEEMEYCIDRDVLETVEKSNLKKMYQELVLQSREDMQLGKLPVWQRNAPLLENEKAKKMFNKLEMDKFIEEHSF